MRSGPRSAKFHNLFSTITNDHRHISPSAQKSRYPSGRIQPASRKFTLPQLQNLYEAIYQTQLDKRNFRKKLNAMDILEKLDEKDKKGSKRGAFYYMFNKEKYDHLLEQGFYFSL